MKLLLHICCANCSLYTVKHLASKGIEFKGFWFNPNIHPEDEYGRRLDALKELDALWGLDIEYLDRYGLDDFLCALEGFDGIRCVKCYEMRLGQTALTAKRMGLDGFTTTLLISPYQKFDLIVDMGRQMEKKYSVPFYFEDFRPGWKETVRISKELGLYRQKYCGCIYSMEERGKIASASPRNDVLRPTHDDKAKFLKESSAPAFSGGRG